MIGQQALFVPDHDLPLRKRVEVEIITVAQARYALETFHYLHRCRTGRQINYAVLIDGVVDGVITMAYPVGNMTLLGLQPGEFVEFARLYLQQNIPHSASCAIGKVLRRFRGDWLRLFPEAKEPQLVVSWSDQEYHKGTIYKAANFQWLRESPGAAAGGLRRGHTRWGERGRYADLGHMKDCWIFWLVKTRGDTQPPPRIARSIGRLVRLSACASPEFQQSNSRGTPWKHRRNGLPLNPTVRRTI